MSRVYPHGSNNTADTAATITHTFKWGGPVEYDYLLITALLWGHLWVTPIKDDGSQCGWDNISTYLPLSLKRIKTDTSGRLPRRYLGRSSETCQIIRMLLSHNVLIQRNYCTAQAVHFHHWGLCTVWSFHYLSWHCNIVYLLSLLYVYVFTDSPLHVFAFYVAARMWFYEAYKMDETHFCFNCGR